MDDNDLHNALLLAEETASQIRLMIEYGQKIHEQTDADQLLQCLQTASEILHSN